MADEPVNVAASIERKLDSTDLGGLRLWLDVYQPVTEINKLALSSPESND